jgi:hypothetical protein
LNYWESPSMNHFQAVELRQRIARKTKKHNIEAGEPWLNMHYLSILGITPKQARNQYKNWLNVYLQETKKIIAHNSQYFNFINKSMFYENSKKTTDC